MKKKKRKNYIIGEALAVDCDKRTCESLLVFDLTDVVTSSLRDSEYYFYANPMLTYSSKDAFADIEDVNSFLDYLHTISYFAIDVTTKVGRCDDNTYEQTTIFRICIVDPTNEHVKCIIVFNGNKDNYHHCVYYMDPEDNYYYSYKALQLYHK